VKNAILERWGAVVAEKGSLPAVLTPDGSVARTFAEIEVESDVVAARLAGVRAKTLASLQAANTPVWTALLLGAWKAGCSVLLVDRAMSEGARDAAEKLCGAGVRLGESGETELEHAAGDFFGEAEPHLIKLTSGTSGTPRAILFRAEQLLADCENICQTMGVREDDMNYGVVAFSHSYGFSNLVTPLLCRGVSLVAARDALPRAVLAGLAASRATVLPAVPTVFQALSEVDGDLANVRLCISAGAPLRPATAGTFRSRFGRKIHTFYGASECGGIAFDADDVDAGAPGFVGRPLNGVEIVPEQDGGIVVRSAAVGLGYFPQAKEEFAGVEFRPADLLERSDAGWRIAGRRTDTINVGGRKVNPVEVESVLLSHPSVREVAVFGVPDAAGRGESVVAWIATFGTDHPHEEILRHCRERLAAWQAPREIRVVASIPLNSRGKVSRRELVRRHLGG
jgi:long-chain acyl-CoA synthetase